MTVAENLYSAILAQLKDYIVTDNKNSSLEELIVLYMNYYHTHYREVGADNKQQVREATDEILSKKIPFTLDILNGVRLDYGDKLIEQQLGGISEYDTDMFKKTIRSFFPDFVLSLMMKKFVDDELPFEDMLFCIMKEMYDLYEGAWKDYAQTH